MRRFSATSRRKGNRIIRVSGAGDGNRTHVRSLGSFYTAIVRRPLFADAPIIPKNCRARIDTRSFLPSTGALRFSHSSDEIGVSRDASECARECRTFLFELQ